MLTPVTSTPNTNTDSLMSLLTSLNPNNHQQLITSSISSHHDDDDDDDDEENLNQKKKCIKSENLIHSTAQKNKMDDSQTMFKLLTSTSSLSHDNNRLQLTNKTSNSSTLSTSSVKNNNILTV